MDHFSNSFKLIQELEQTQQDHQAQGCKWLLTDVTDGFDNLRNINYGTFTKPFITNISDSTKSLMIVLGSVVNEHVWAK
ncbi:13142_t:CDS:2, partial [Cetraspora pellucida]